MEKALVVLTEDEPEKNLLAASERFATGTDTELLVVRFVEEGKYRSKIERGAESGKDDPTIGEIEASARADAETVAEDSFGDDISYKALGVVGTFPDDVIRIAEENNVIHVFVTGRKRSPTGKALFGDVAQSIILDFDGPVTVTTR